jgi:hypothetical protein
MRCGSSDECPVRVRVLSSVLSCVAGLIAASGEHATSGLQILSDADQEWSAHVGTRWLRDLQLSRMSGVGDDGQPDLTQI